VFALAEAEVKFDTCEIGSIASTGLSEHYLAIGTASPPRGSNVIDRMWWGCSKSAMQVDHGAFYSRLELS
jgi:hypothetical protein